MVGNITANLLVIQEMQPMLNQAEMIWGRFNGNNVAPIGSYVNFRTMSVFQQATDGNVPAAGTWCRVDPNAAASFTSLANTINAALGTSFTNASFHTYTTADNVTSPGQMTNDA